MDKVLVTGLLVAAGVITAIILFGVFRTSIQESGSSATGMQSQAALQAETGARILEVIGVGDGTVFDIWAKNMGSAEILPIENLVLSIMDMNGTSEASVEYGPSDPLTLTWQLVGNNSRWLPGETIQLRAKLFLTPATSKEHILSIDTLSGSTGAFIFDVIPGLPVTPQPTIATTATPTPAPGPTSTPTPTPVPPSGSCTATEPSSSGPRLDSIEMSTGYPRQLLSVNGDTDDASVIWSAGDTSTETTISTGQGGTRYFQIPDTAGPGIYPVALRTSAGTSNIRCVTVKPASGTFPGPRVQYIGLNGRTGNDLAVTVSAANLDQDATMTVNGTLVSGSYLSSGLPLPFLLNHIPATYGYPIYHYGQLRGLVQNVTPGSTLNVTVTNRDGKTSTKSYTLPGRWEDLDSDSDGLLDIWEDGVYTAPSGGTVNLAAMGTGKYKKDLLVEAEWVAAAAPGTANYDDTIWSLWKDWSIKIPLLNPDGTRGLNLIIDRGQGGAFTEGGQTLTPNHRAMGYESCSSSGWVDFMTYKNNFFNRDRSGLFHYLILGRAAWCGSEATMGGEARFPLDGPTASCPECGGDNLFVVCTGCSSEVTAGIVAHEMGHDLGLSHGGLYPTLGPVDHNNDKPNSHSIMNYRWTVGGIPAGCGQNELPRDSGTGPKGVFGQGMLATIDERNVDESKGICDGVPIDFNNDGQFTIGAINTDRYGTLGVHEDTPFDQVGNLILDFRACWADPQGLVRRATCR